MSIRVYATPPARQAEILKLANVKPPSQCLHLGAPTGATVACIELKPDGTKACGHGTQLKVFACAVHGTATQARKGEGVTGCCKIGTPQQCQAYQASTPAAPSSRA